jgi:hypothetical protein
VTARHPFRAAVEEGGIEAGLGLLHPDVVFRSPAVFAPYEGKAAVGHLLRQVAAVFEDFRYVDELRGEHTAGLVFEASVGDRELQGWDYLTSDDEGLITEFVVMIRPLSALLAVAEAMQARLTADQPAG